ncbi:MULTISPECIES: carbohydrate ABC transporter permease [unclassified Paenibacillus]|uniref:carbohydrate ABC transporter permease n=1 Tax=unclassified Paenibacillus TaxID=185978 RepID=UPI001C10427C|nr:MULTISPECIES: sugar ABC transporter permease [unclassified Paenibacillus]MBU5440912.1 sugar ABC transporter permease [Paenibacillus sp. MSJ-34]CAH0118385.1 Melibiose/raffinose/stachyose import permease protein MelD [Paenibacillus sp. CECT 9249]
MNAASSRQQAQTIRETAPRPRMSRMKREKIVPVLMITPSLIAIAIFVYGFIGWTGYVSLTNWNTLVKNMDFAGLNNYAFLFQDFRFQSDLRNTFVFTVLFIAATMVFGLFLATIVDRKIRAESLFRNIFIFPMALSFIVTGVVWQWILNPSTGVNLILKAIGMENLPKWYVSTEIIPGFKPGQIELGIPIALIAVVIATVWQMSGFAMAMYLAGLRGISDELKEAARVDGAAEWTVFRRIVLPQLKPITISLVIMLTHVSLKIFDLIYAMTGPGAMFVTDVPGVYMFETTFRGNHYAQGASIAMIMLILVSLLIVPYIMSSMKKEDA